MEKFFNQLISWLRSPWRKSASLSRLLLIGLIILGGTGLLRIHSLRGNFLSWSVDFNNIYLGSRMAAEGKNPYCDEDLKMRWQRLCREEGIVSNVTPGLPERPLLYPPWALGMTLPFSLFPYRYALLLWYVLLAASFIGIGVFGWLLFGRHLPAKTTIMEILLFCIAFKSVPVTLLSGQPGYIVYAALLASLYFFKTSRPFMGGLFLGIASMKIVLVFPFCLYLLLKKEMRGLLGALCLAGVSLAAFSLVSGGPHIDSYLHLATTFNKLRLPPDFNISFFIDDKFQTSSMSEMGTLLLLVKSELSGPLPWIYAATAGILLFIAGRGAVSGRYGDLHSLLLFLCATMLTIYCQYYDQLLFLIFLFPFIRTLPRRTAALFYGINALQLFPMTGMVRHIPLLRYDFPLPLLLQPVLAIVNITLLFTVRPSTPKKIFGVEGLTRFDLPQLSLAREKARRA